MTEEVMSEGAVLLKNDNNALPMYNPLLPDQPSVQRRKWMLGS